MSVSSRSTFIRQSADHILMYLAAHHSGKTFAEIQEACMLQWKQGPEIFNEAFRAISNQLVQGQDGKIFLKAALASLQSKNVKGGAPNPKENEEKND